MPLAVSPCRSLCAWSADGGREEGQERFSCAGCGSQWVATEPWTPRQADGSVPAAVRAARLLTTGRPAAGAGSGGS